MADHLVITEPMIEHRFGYHRAGPGAANRHADIREVYILAGKALVQLVPQGRELALALTALQESMMWANAGVAMLSPIAPDPRVPTVPGEGGDVETPGLG